MTDEQLMLLEELTYFDSDFWDDSGEVPNHGKTVGDALSGYDEEKLAAMEEAGGNSAKRAAIIREIQNNDQLKNLEIVDKDSDVYAITYQDPATGEIIVTFRGTATPDEWRDNALGLYQPDTPCQIDALEYIEGLPYDHITVVGHSKGGNKAQYVTLLSDKVDRCVSVDGQGFCQEFYDKYYAEVQKKGHLIINYYKDGDFVNILLFPVFGSTQTGISTSDDVVNGKFHNMESAFQYAYDENGHIYIVCDENGNPILLEGNREALMQYAHEFTSFIVNVMPEKDREDVAQYIGALLAIARKGNYVYKGECYTDIKTFLLSDPKMLGLVLAYLMKYVETYNPSEEELNSLLSMLQLSDFFETIRVSMQNDPDLKEAIGSTAADIFLWLMDNLKDGDRDRIIEAIWATLFGDNAALAWQEAEAAYADIPKFDKDTANQHGTLKTGKVRDFSRQTYDRLMNSINGIDRITVGSASNWYSYSGEEWYDDLMIDNMIRGINAYFNRVGEINQQSKIKIDSVFNEAYDIDNMTAENLHSATKRLAKTASAVRKIAAQVC